MNDSLLDAILQNPIKAVAEFYASCFGNDARAAEYARDPLQLDAEAIATQRVGFADRSLGNQIPSRRIKLGR